MQRNLLSFCSLLLGLYAGAQYPSRVLYQGNGFKIVQTPSYSSSTYRPPRFEDYYNPRFNTGSSYSGRTSSSTSRSSSGATNRTATPARSTSGVSGPPVPEPYEQWLYGLPKEPEACIAKLEKSRYWEGSLDGTRLPDEWIERYAALHLRCYAERKQYAKVVELTETGGLLRAALFKTKDLGLGSAAYIRGLALLQLGRAEEVLDLWSAFDNLNDLLTNGRAARTDVGSSERTLLLQMGLIAYEQGLFLEAANALGTVLDQGEDPVRDGSNYPALYGHAQIESFNAEQGLKFLKASNNWNTVSDEEKFEILSKGYLYAGQFDQCAALSREHLKQPGTRLVAALRLIDCDLYQQNWSAAEAAAETLLREDKTNLYAFYRQAFARVMQGNTVDLGRFDELMQQAAAAGKLTDKNRNICESVKMLFLARKGDLQAAAAILNRRSSGGYRQRFRDPIEFFAVNEVVAADGHPEVGTPFLAYAVSAHFGAALDQAKKKPVTAAAADAAVSTKIVSLTEAVRLKDREALKKLVALGRAKGDFDALQAACQMNDAEAVELLLAGGADPSGTDGKGMPVFYWLPIGYYLEQDGKCPVRIFELMKRAGLKIGAQTAERYLLMNRESLKDAYGKGEYKNKACKKCDEAITAILKSCVVNESAGFGGTADPSKVMIKRGGDGLYYFYVVESGLQLLSPQGFEMADRFSEGLAAVQLNGQWGYMDLTGKIVIPCQYKTAEAFSGGRAQVMLTDAKRVGNVDIFYIDKAGKRIK